MGNILDVCNVSRMFRNRSRIRFYIVTMFVIQVLFLFFVTGTRWTHRGIGGGVRQIESGPEGITWGVGKHGSVYYRTGVRRRNPVGRQWICISGCIFKLGHVTVGCTGVYGVNIRQWIWRYQGM